VKYSGTYAVSGQSVSVSAKEVITVGRLSIPVTVHEKISWSKNSLTVSETAQVRHALVNATTRASLTVSWRAKSAGKVTQVLTHARLQVRENVSAVGKGKVVVSTVASLNRLVNGTAIVLRVGNEETGNGVLRVASNGDIEQGSSSVSKVGGKVVRKVNVDSLINWEGTTILGRRDNTTRVHSTAFFGGMGIVNKKHSFSVQGTYDANARAGRGRAGSRRFALSVADAGKVRVGAESVSLVGSRASKGEVRTGYAARAGEDIRIRGQRRAIRVRVDVLGGQKVAVNGAKGSFKGGARVRVAVF